MDFKSYETLSRNVKEQIEKVKNIWLKYIGKSIIGIYIHGSIALNCFVEGISDIDILIVCSRKINREERLLISKNIMEVDCRPCHLEMSVLWINDLNPWTYPTPCQFHYSDTCTEHYKNLLNGSIKNSFIVDEDFWDTDIACHVHLTNQSGICIYGKPVKDVFPVIPEKDFWDSISNNITEYNFETNNPRYFASNILILGRILSYKKEKRILSKYEGGIWTLHYVPEKLRYIIDNAMKEWYFEEKEVEYKKEDLEELKSLLVNEILY